MQEGQRGINNQHVLNGRHVLNGPCLMRDRVGGHVKETLIANLTNSTSTIDPLAGSEGRGFGRFARLVRFVRANGWAKEA